MSDINPLVKYNGDVYLYLGTILRSGYQQISDVLESHEEKSDNGLLVLITHGGDPDAAYRIGRAFNHHYKTNFEILIPDICKSAGTLLCVGARSLIFGDRGEMGPLDIQLSKPDEMFDSMSGLDIIQAVNALQTQMLSAFRAYLVDIRGGSGIRTKISAEIAAQLAKGFVSPIAAKIDPVTLGEHQRAMSISLDYGERLNELSDALNPDALMSLVSDYPSHGFVIDRKEASSLFRNVSAPDECTYPIYQYARQILENVGYKSEPLVCDLSKTLDGIEEETLEAGNETEKTDNSDESGKTNSPNGKAEPESSSNEQTAEQSNQPKIVRTDVRKGE